MTNSANRAYTEKAQSRRIAVLATLDTKGNEAAYVADRIRQLGHEPLLIDLALAQPRFDDAGLATYTIVTVLESDTVLVMSRPDAMKRMAEAAGILLAEEVALGNLHGALAIGGGTGSWMAQEAFGSLPVGFPKLVVTTVPRGEGTSDITLMPSVADIAGINRLLAPILANAAAAVCGMAAAPSPTAIRDRPTVALTMFGVTTAGGTHVRRMLEEAGCEVIVFHATGAGGRTMEKLVREGYFDAVLDWTTSEVTDELVGGLCTAGPHRLEAAGAVGIPQLIVPGAVDVINVLAPIPEKFSGRLHHWHLPTVPLIRTNAAESSAIGAWIAGKLNGAAGPTAVLIPAGGNSSLDCAGGEFEDQAANEAFEEAIRTGLRDDITVSTHPGHINDEAFARTAADLLLGMLEKTPSSSTY